MDEKWDHRQNETEETAPTSHVSGWVIAAVVVMVIGLGLFVGHTYRQQSASNPSASHEAEMTATINQMQGQIDALTAKLNEVVSAPSAPSAPANGAQPAADPAAAKRRTASENKHIKQLQSQLADQQHQLKETQDQVAQARSDLEGSLGSTRDELNGSIAKTHDEVIALEQKGERTYVEFDLVKAKHFRRMGPVMLSLRKTDIKHKNYDLAMIVDDNQLGKKHVNLYEPLWIDGTDSQQVQVVVNMIDKDRVHGYVSAPKYSQSASLTPVSTRTDTTPTEPAVYQSGPTSPSSNSSGGSSPTTTELPQ